MGNLDFQCVTSDASGQTLYAIAITYDYSSTRISYSANTAVLVESKLTSSTTNHKDLTWSVVSAFTSRYTPFYGGKAYANACAISNSGEFTFFSPYVMNQGASLAIKPPPRGLRYLPNETMDPSFGYTGKGAWRNLTVSDTIKWDNGINTHLPKLFYTSAGGTGEKLMFVVAYDGPRYDSSGVQLGVFNPETNSLDYVGTWSWLNSLYGSPKGIAYAGDELYIYGTQLTNAMLTAFSLKNTTTTTSPVALRAYNATSTSSACWLTFTNYVHTAVFKGSYYLACGVPEIDAQNHKGQLFTIKDITTNITSFGPNVTIPYPQLESNVFVPVSAGNEPFAFLQRQGVARSLILDGPQAGIIHDGINVTIAESYGDDPSPKPPSSINSDDGTLGAGAVVGIIAGVVVMVGVLFTLLKSKNKKNTSSTMTNPQHAPLGGPLNPYFQKETFGPDRPNQFRYPLPTSVPTHALPMAPITPMPAPLMAAQPHTFQDQMQGLQFSSHPRPNFVTTGVAATGYGEGGLLPGAQTSVTGTAVWQPTPFVPPPSTRPSGAAPISTSVNTSGTTIATPSVVGSPQVPNTTRPQAPQFVEQHVDTGNGNRS